MSEWKEFSGKSVDEALNSASSEFNAAVENIEYEIVEEESAGFLGLFGNKPAKIKARVKLSIEDKAKSFLCEVLGAMGISASVSVANNEEDGCLEISMDGDEMGILIGKRGQTLDSLQYLVSLVINKESDEYLKVKLDTENYRERRKETLENLATNIAMKVKKTHRAVTLEPMNPYERRIIHSTLQNDKYVDTHSEGDEPFRKIVVTPKKGLKEYSSNKYGGNKYGNKRNDNRRGGYRNSNKITSHKEFTKKYGENTKDYSTDYKKDYAAYLEQKAASRAAEAAKNAGSEN